MLEQKRSCRQDIAAASTALLLYRPSQQFSVGLAKKIDWIYYIMVGLFRNRTRAPWPLLCHVGHLYPCDWMGVSY